MVCTSEGLRTTKHDLNGLRIVYVTTEPKNQPRLLKIRSTLTRRGAKFVVFRPRYPSIIGNRMLRGILNYTFFLIQAFAIRGDVIWVSNCPDITALPFAMTGRRYIYDFRSPWSKELSIEFGRGFLFRLSEVVEKIARRHASVIVMVSRRMVRDVSGLKVPLFIVPNFPFRNFSARIDRQTFRRSVGVSDSDKVAVFVGRLTKVEGADMLKDVAEALSKVPGARLWVAGDGPLRSDIQRLVRMFPDTVKYFGWVPHEDVPNLIVGADISIMPRHKNPNADYYSEEGVHKISESIWLKTPVIACNVARSPYYVSVDDSSFVSALIALITGGLKPPPKIPSWEDASEPELIKAIAAAIGSG